MPTEHLAAFAALLATLLIAHHIADYWVQTSWQAAHKADRAATRPWRTTGRTIGWGKWLRINAIGWYANLAHVATYTLTAAAAIVVLAWRLDLPLDTGRLAAGLAISAITHAIADRRRPLIGLIRLLGKHDPDWLFDQGGLAHLDQAWHLGWLLIAALVMA